MIDVRTTYELEKVITYLVTNEIWINWIVNYSTPHITLAILEP